MSFGGFVLFCLIIHGCLKQRKMREEKEKREVIDGDNHDDDAEIFVETKLWDKNQMVFYILSLCIHEFSVQCVGHGAMW